MSSFMTAPSRVTWTGVCVLASITLATGCGVKDRIEDRIQREVGEKFGEIAAGGEVDIETSKDGKVSIEAKDGSKVHVDGEAGQVVVTDAEGKTHVYEQGADGSATVRGSDGLDAEFAAKIPEGFPLALPAMRSVAAGQRTQTPEGALVFAVNGQAKSEDIEAVAAGLRGQFEARGMSVESSEFASGTAKTKTLAAKDPSGKIEASAMLTFDAKGQGEPGVIMLLSWSDRSAVQE